MHAQSLWPTFPFSMPELVLAAGSAFLRGVGRIVEPLGSNVSYRVESAEAEVSRQAAETWQEIGAEMQRAMNVADRKIPSRSR